MGKEWELFREGLAMLWDLIEESPTDPDCATTGVWVFDQLRPASKLAMMALVGQALHDPAEPCPELTALTEATFAAVYTMIRAQIELEIECAKLDPAPRGDHDVFRKRVLATFHEVSPEWPGPLPRSDCADLDEWNLLLDELMDRVLWDRDFEEDGLFLDADPDRGDPLKKELGIAEDYFTAIAPDPTKAQLATIRETLRRLCEQPQHRDPPESGKSGANPWF